MPLRNITLQAAINEMAGGETWELWIKPEGGAWAMHSSGAVSALASPPSFAVNGLAEGVVHTAQLRAARDGRYRTGYLNADPDTWPAQSRLSFMPGAPELSAPTIGTAVWERVGFLTQRTVVTVTPNASQLGLTLQLLRGDVIVATANGPHSGAPIQMVDPNPPLAADHAYTARHVDLTLEGPRSAVVHRWSGPNAPTGLNQSGAGAYRYNVAWTVTVAGAVTRIEDNYRCGAEFAHRHTSAVNAVSSPTLFVEEEHLTDDGNPIFVGFGVRARHEVTSSFGPVDVSDWNESSVSGVQIMDNETAYNSCL